MRHPHKLGVAVAIIAVLSLGFVGLGAASSAQALAPSPPITPGQLKSFLVGVPSSVLSAAQTSPTEGAQSAGMVPGSTDMSQFESQFAPPVAKPVGPVRAGVGGGALLVASAAWGERANIADGTLSLFGVNANDSVCKGGGEGAWTGLVQGITGQTCSPLVNASPGYVANADQTGGTVTGEKVCTANGARCVQLMGYDVSGFSDWSITGSAAVDANTAIWVTSFAGGTPGQVYNGVIQGGDFPGQYPAKPTATAYWYMSYPLDQGYSEYWAEDPASNPNAAHSNVTKASTDPLRTLKCVVLGSDGQLRTASTDSFHESDATWPQVVCPSQPAHVIPDDTKYYEVTPGQPDVLIEDLPATTPFKDWAATYPGCTGGGCVLDIYSADGQTDCNALPSAAGCADWFTDPNRADDWVCKYNGQPVAMSECNVISQFYKPDALQDGGLYADPATGDPIPGSSSRPGVIAPGTEVQDPTKARACFPNGWSGLNPVEWVVLPVGCALQWAFVPRTEVVQEDVQSMQDEFKNKAPGKLIALAGQFQFTAPTGCNGITMDISWLTHNAGQTVQIMQACPGDVLAGMAAWSRFFGDLAFVIYGLIAVTRHVARIFAFGGLGGSDGAE